MATVVGRSKGGLDEEKPWIRQAVAFGYHPEMGGYPDLYNHLFSLGEHLLHVSVKQSMRKSLLVLIIGAGAAGLLMRAQTTNTMRPFEHGLSSSATNVIALPEAKNLMLFFALTNTSSSAINPSVTESSLRVNGKEMKDWLFTVANGPRDSRWKSLPPGDHLLFGYAMGEHFYVAWGLQCGLGR